MKPQGFFQDVSSEPNETTNEPDQSTERSMAERAKELSNWTPMEGRCLGFDRHAQSIRECVNARFISRSHKVVKNVTQAQLNTIRALKSNHNIVFNSAYKGGAIVIQNRKDYCKEGYRQLNNTTNNYLPTKEHTYQ
eukprot:g18261.t1